MAPGARQWFFDAWSRVYDTRIVQRATYRPVQDAVIEALGHGMHRRVLDIGCGTGLLAQRVAALPKTRVIGCDFSRGMLTRAAARARGYWVQADATRLPFGDAAFDAVVSTEAFHWFPDQVAALGELFRVVRPDGRLLLALVNTPTAVLSTAFHLGSRVLGEPFYWPTTAEMRRMVEAAGFRVERQRRVYRLPGFLLPPVLTCAVRPSKAKRPQ